jgi:ATP-binding cassette subfamily F protein 3
LLRATCDELWLVADGGIQPFDGDLDDYADWLGQQRAAQRATEKPVDENKIALREDRVAEEARRKSTLVGRRQAEKEIQKLEKQLASWQGELALLEQRLADPALYSAPDPTLMQSLTKRQAELSAQIEATETRWLELHEELEAAAI